MSLSARNELLTSIRTRYANASRAEKSTILTEFTAATGLHRKYALTLLNAGKAKAPAGKRARVPRRYGAETEAALITVWEAANRICSKRLVPFLPTLCEALMRHGRLPFSEAVRDNLLRMSPATVDRLLASARGGATARPHTAPRKVPSLRQRIPVRTFTEWTGAKAGDCEADLVAHCGTSMAGSFLYSLTVTDVATGWTECTGLLFRDQQTTLDGLRRIRKQLPVALTSFDTDNGSEFINEVVFAFCEREKIKFTRSRPYKKNDQCFIEQKNGNVVRRNVGYERFEGIATCQALNELYAVLRLYVNFFQPSVKLIEKTRNGSKTTRKYDVARTPFQRMMESEDVSAEAKVRLKTAYISLDPLDLLERLRRRQDRLWATAVATPTAPAGERTGEYSPTTVVTTRDKPAERLEDSPASSHRAGKISSDVHWRKGKRSYKRSGKPRTWRTRTDPFELVWDDIVAMLTVAPYQSAKAILAALQGRYPGVFPNKQLRTLQRQVHRWRVQQTLVETPQPDGVLSLLETTVDSGDETREDLSTLAETRNPRQNVAAGV